MLDAGFWEAGDLEKTAGDSRVAGGVESGGRLGLVGSYRGAGVEVGAGADGDLDVVERPLGFDYAAPVERGVGFGESGDSAGKFATIETGLQRGGGVAMEDHARAEIKKQDTERENGAETAARALTAGADFFGDEAAEKREKDSGKENGKEPEVEGGEPVEGEAACGERPEELDTGGLTNVEDEMEKGCRERGEEDGCARDWDIGGFGLEEKKGKNKDKAEGESGEERMKVSAVKSEVGGRAEIGAEEVDVGNCAYEDDGQRDRAREARKRGALKS